MTTTDRSSGRIDREQHRTEFFEKLESYGVDWERFAKPADALEEECWKGDTELKVTVHNGVSRLIALRQSVLLDITAINPKTGQVYRFGESYREFPKNGKQYIRFPQEKFLSESICVGSKEDSFRAAIRCLAEEANILQPRLALLQPKNEHPVAKSGFNTSPVQNRARFELRESDSFEGILSGAIIKDYQYDAQHHWSDDMPCHISVDEYGVTTYAEWHLVT